MRRDARGSLFIVVAILMTVGGFARANMVSISVTRDAAIYSEPLPLANGSGSYLFAGVNGVNNSENIRRSMLYFDLSAIPMNAVITSATLRLNVDREPFGAGNSEATLHAAESEWGEGPSDPSGLEGTGTTAGPGDATWNDAFHGVTAWGTAGGDFNSTASASQTLSGLGLVFFSSPQMVNDVQAWYDAPSQNYGWFLLGDETGTRNARRFTSGEDSDLESILPQLSIGYSIVPEPATFGLMTLGLGMLIRRRKR